jgi:hypothetical protein
MNRLSKQCLKTSTTAFLLLIFLVPSIGADATLVLKNAFIEKYKNKVTMTVDFIVDHAHEHPNAIKDDGKDGDMHFSGRAPEVGLPMVAEIVNAAKASQKGAVDLVHGKEAQASKKPLRLTGAWRLWFEHPPKKGVQQVQGQPVPVPKNTNPDHVFEIHPTTQVGSQSTLKSFVPIPNFEAYNADTAFEYYEKLRLAVKANNSATILSSVQAKYNYAEFAIELTGAPVEVEDGFFVLATVLDSEGNTMVSNPRRMVFAKETAPAQKIKSSKKGDRLRVLGIPRVNLERISFLTRSATGAEHRINLPYEMIIVAVF